MTAEKSTPKTAEENAFETAKSNVLIVTKLTPKPAFIYRSQADLKALIDWSKIQPKVRIDEKTAAVVLTMGKFDLVDNVLITLNDLGKVADVINLTKANELYNVVASK
jgi:hypothetical protein